VIFIPVPVAIWRRIWLRLALSAEIESAPSAKVTFARFGGSCAGVRGIGGGAGVVVGEVAGSVDCCGEAEGLACGVGGACASNDAERARLATAVKRIGAKLCMLL
jgi:hypothetical protein